jgi:cysteine desulfurase
MTRRIYLDYAATTPVDPAVVQEMLPYFTEMYGNPSSVHSCGQEVRDSIEEARSQVAIMIGAQPSEIVFTSGGSEANNLALKGIVAANYDKRNHIITTTLEHHSVSETCKFLGESGHSVTYVPVDRYGMADPFDIKKAITVKTILVSVMHANNEVGAIQPIAEIAKICHEAGAFFHTDAVQTTGHIPIDVKNLDVDLLSMSAHKLYGPKGVGALYIKDTIRVTPLIHGGSQESGRRASTENVPSIVGFGKAAQLALTEMDTEIPRLIVLRGKLITGLKNRVADIELNGHPTQRLPNNVNVSIAAIEGESVLLNLDLAGICVSTGSACSSTSQEASHVLLAMGIPPEQARCSLRLTLGRWTTEAEIERVFQQLPPIVARLRAMSPLYK